MSDAFESLHWLTTCRCDPAYTDRKLHAPDCPLEYRDDVDEALAAAQRRGWDQAIAALRAEADRLDANWHTDLDPHFRGRGHRHAADYLTAVRDTPAGA